MNFGLNYAPGAELIVRPVDCSVLPLCHGCTEILLLIFCLDVIISYGTQGSNLNPSSQIEGLSVSQYHSK